MIQFLHHDLIDKSRWDDCISHVVNGNLNAFSWYLDIVSPGWCAFVEGDYENVFPLPVSSRLGIKYIMQPFFTQQLGLFCKSSYEKEKIIEFLKSIPSGYKYVDINLNTLNQIHDAGNIIAMTNLELELMSEYDIIAAGYQTNLQRNLKKAGQNNLTIIKQIQPEDLIKLFRANKGQELKHLNDKQYLLIQQIANESIQRGIGEIWGAYDEFKQLVAGILWVTSHQKSIFLFSALSETGRKLNAMPWLIDAFIRQNAGQPLILDFEGSNDEGLARFYSSFGARKVIYYKYVRNSLPTLFCMALKLWRLRKQQLKK